MALLLYGIVGYPSSSCHVAGKRGAKKGCLAVASIENLRTKM